jgi:hypothetical protein
VSGISDLRPSWPPQPKFPFPLFSIFSLAAILVESRDHRTQLWKGPCKDHSTKVWLQLVKWFLRRRFLCEPFQNCVRHFRPPTKMAVTAELNLT